MPAFPPRLQHSLALFYRARFWRTLLIAIFPAVLLAQSTTVFELPIGRAGHDFTLHQLRTPPATGFDSTPLTLEIGEPPGDGSPATHLFVSTTEILANDYFITDESSPSRESTAPNQWGAATFFRRSFVTTPWFNGDQTPSTSFFIALPESRFGHALSLYTSNTSSVLTLSPVLSYLSVDAAGNPTVGSYGFFEAWTSSGPASDGPAWFLVDHDLASSTVALAPVARDLLNVTWEPLAGTSITRSVDVRLAQDNRNAVFTLHAGQGYVQNLSPTVDAYGGVHVTAVIGINQEFWLRRTVDGLESPRCNLGFFDAAFDLTAAFPPNPAADDEQGSNTSGTPVYLKIPASRWDHTFTVLDVNDNVAGMLNVDHMQGFWSMDQYAQSWFTSYYYLDATAYSPGPGWRLWDSTANEVSERNPRDLTAWLPADAQSDTDGDTLVDWYERLIGTNPTLADSDGDGMPDGWEIKWGFNPLSAADATQDADGDGLSNRDEYTDGTNPRNPDTDDDGMPDGWEVNHGLNPLLKDALADDDGDGLNNLGEYNAGTDPHNTDSDGDGMPDGYEVAHGFNPNYYYDGGYDADGDGLTNAVEYTLGTNPNLADSDHDGMPDNWELAYGLNPNLDDSAGDPDHDGLSNLDEYRAGTNPTRADTDNDGQTDGWEHEHGGDPLHFGFWHALRLPAGRFGHHFTLHREGLPDWELPVTMQSDYSGLWTQGFVELFSGVASVSDNTVGDAVPLVENGQPVLDFTLAGAWSFGDSRATHRQFFIIPAARGSDLLLLLAGGVVYPVTVVPYAGPSFYAPYGEWVGSGNAVEASAECPGGSDFRLVDLSDNTRSPDSASVLTGGPLGSWVASSFTLPLRNVSIRVAPADAGRRFIVQCGGYSSQFYQAPWSGWPLAFEAAVVPEVPFTIIREDDYARALASAQGDDYDVSSLLGGDPHPSPVPPDFQWITFKVGAGHTGLWGTAEDGSPLSAWPNGTGGHLYGWDDAGHAVTYDYVNYTAFVDVNHGYSFVDAGGASVFVDFVPWSPDAGPNAIAIAMNDGRRSHALFLVDATGSHPLRFQPGYESATYYYTASETIYPGQADARASSASLPYAEMVVAGDPSQPFSILDDTAGEAIPFPSGSTGVVDLSRWEVNVPVYLEITAARLGHTLEIHTDEGVVFPVAQQALQNGWSFASGADLLIQSQAWYFLATATRPQYREWWVYDRTTNEVAASNTTTLHPWALAAPAPDSDGDGLPDWFELAVGLDPHWADSDGDQMPDGWELQHGLNPTLAADAEGDLDGDGLTNLAEYHYGTNPSAADTDGDGMADDWEISHGLDPLVNDGSDPDGDGLTTVQEIALGTDPYRADSDRDGMSDGWELAHDGDPLIAGDWHVLRMFAGRIGHHFTRWREGTPLEFHPKLTYGESRSWAEGWVELGYPGETIIDDTTGDSVWLPFRDAPDLVDLSMNPQAGGIAWSFAVQQTVGCYQETVLLPQTMVHDVLVVYSFDLMGFLVSPTTQVPYTGSVPLPLRSGQTVIPSDLCEARCLMRSNSNQWLINITTGQKAAVNGPNPLAFEWEPNDTSLPLQEATLGVHRDDGGRRFVVACPGQAVQFIRAPFPEASAWISVIHASVVPGLPFTIYREDDPGQALSLQPPDPDTLLNLSAEFPNDPNPSPLPPYFQQICFKVGVNHTGIVGHDSFGLPLAAWSDGTGGQLNFWDAAGQTQPYQYLNYYSVVDIVRPYEFADSAGTTNLLDSTPWIPDAPAYSIAIAIPPARQHDDLVIYNDPAAPWAVRVQPGYENLTFYYGVDEILFLGESDESHLETTCGYLAAIADFSPALAFTVEDKTTGERLSFGEDASRTKLDLSRWESSHSVDLTISATHFGHVLEVHTDTGGKFPVELVQMNDAFIIGSTLDLQTYAKSWSFSASSAVPSDNSRRWWLYDRTTNQRADDFAYNTTAWLALDRTVDTDGDGLPNWFERGIGLNPNKADFDGDGINDGIEVIHRLNPFVAQIDTDGDGMSDLWEIEHGLDPLNPTDRYADRDGDGISNGDEYGAGHPGELPDPNLDSDGDGIPDVIEIQNGTDPFQSDLLDSDGDGVPNYRDAWPFDPLLQGKPQPITQYAIIEIYRLEATERVDKLLLGEDGQVAYQLSRTDQPLAAPTAFYWSGSGSPPAPQQMIDSTASGPTEIRTFGGIISLTQDGTVFGKWTKTTGDETNACAQFPINRRYFPSAKWASGQITYADPQLLPEPFYPPVVDFSPHTRFRTVLDDFFLDRYGLMWSVLTEFGEMARLNRDDVRYCLDTNMPYYGTKQLADGNIPEILYHGEHVDIAGLDLGSSDQLHAAFNSLAPNINPLTASILSGGDALTFLTANDIGSFLATAPGKAPNIAATRFFISNVDPQGSCHVAEITAPFPVAPSSIVALSNDGVILANDCLVAQNANGLYQRVNPRLNKIASGGPISWADFNVHHTAVGTQGGAARSAILIDDTVYDLAKLCGGSTALRFDFGAKSQVPQIINDKGLIVAVATSSLPSASSPYGSIVLLVPLELKDVRGGADDKLVGSMDPVPAQNQGEADQPFWIRRNAYFQQQVADNDVALIEPHRGANGGPEMPHLVARLLGGPVGVKLKWRLEVEYLRGNGYRADYVNDFTLPEDKVRIPAVVPNGNPEFTTEMHADQPWSMFQSADWAAEIAQRGLFGGTAKLFIWQVGQANPPNTPVATFRIGGKNPNQLQARQYIDQTAGAPFWYAYAIARNETVGFVKEGGHNRFYNAFYTEYQGNIDHPFQPGLIGDSSVEMRWAGWAKAWPLYNLDRGTRRNGTRYQNGPGGYGLFQLTLGPKQAGVNVLPGQENFIERKEIWNWQENAKGALVELQGKAAAAEALRNALQLAYPQWGPIPNEGHLSGLDAIVVTLYNGTDGLPSRRINGVNRNTPWTAEMAGQTRRWQFHQNSQDYVKKVNAQINSNIP